MTWEGPAPAQLQIVKLQVAFDTPAHADAVFCALKQPNALGQSIPSRIQILKLAGPDARRLNVPIFTALRPSGEGFSHALDGLIEVATTPAARLGALQTILKRLDTMVAQRFAADTTEAGEEE